MRVGFVADDVAELVWVLSAALEQRCAGVTQLRLGHACLFCLVVRQDTGKARFARHRPEGCCAVGAFFPVGKAICDYVVASAVEPRRACDRTSIVVVLLGSR
jgi:hypothetical protein